MGVSDQLFAPASLLPGKESPVPIEYVAGHGLDILGGKSLRSWESNHCFPDFKSLDCRFLFVVMVWTVVRHAESGPRLP